MEAYWGTIILFGSLILGLLTGLPIAFTLSAIGIIFTYFLWGPQGFFMIASTAFDKGTDFILVALPLFILMGNFLEVSGIADSLYEMMHRWFGRVAGGLAVGTIIICAIFAAMAGISGAATVSMGLVAIPSMLRRKYDKQLILGTIASGGALGILIPPSIIAIIYCSVTGLSVSKVYTACFGPGILLSVLYIIYILVRCMIQPHIGPPVEERFTFREKLASTRYVIGPLLIIGVVLGTMYLGVCTPTESAAMGAFGTAVICGIHGKLTWKNIKVAALRTFSISGMCMWIVFGAFCFCKAYSVSGAAEFVTSLVVGLGIPPMAYIWIMMILLIFLGCFMETAAITLITVPIFLPIISALGFNPVWFGVLFIINAEMGLLSPPFGMTLFWLKAVVPPEITMTDIYRSILPFIGVQFIAMVMVMYLPAIAMWLPSLMK